jgi:hypothetical protein
MVVMPSPGNAEKMRTQMQMLTRCSRFAAGRSLRLVKVCWLAWLRSQSLLKRHWWFKGIRHGRSRKSVARATAEGRT